MNTRLALFGLVLLPAMVSVSRAQNARLLDVRTVYIVPSDDRGTVRQISLRLPVRLGWEVVHEPGLADAILGVNRSEKEAGYWIYESPQSVHLTGTVQTRILMDRSALSRVDLQGHTSGGSTTAVRTTRRYGHVAIYDIRSGELLYRYSTRLWFPWSKVTGGFLDDLRSELRYLRAAHPDLSVPPAGPSSGSPAPHEDGSIPDFTTYAGPEDFDGRVWTFLDDSAKAGYLIGFRVGLNRVRADLQGYFADAAPELPVSPLLAASRIERSRFEKRRKSLHEEFEQRLEEATSVRLDTAELIERLDSFYEDPGNLEVLIVHALRSIDVDP